MSQPFACQALDELAVFMVGDNQTPNIYFVSRGSHIEMVTCDGDAAYAYWQSIPGNVESCLEDRLVGVLASTEPVEDGSSVLVSCDDFKRFRRDS